MVLDGELRELQENNEKLKQQLSEQQQQIALQSEEKAKDSDTIAQL